MRESPHVRATIAHSLQQRRFCKDLSVPEIINLKHQKAATLQTNDLM